MEDSSEDREVNINNRTTLPPLLGFVWQVSGGNVHQLSWGSSQHDSVSLLCGGRGRDFTVASYSYSWKSCYIDRTQMRVSSRAQTNKIKMRVLHRWVPLMLM